MSCNTEPNLALTTTVGDVPIATDAWQMSDYLGSGAVSLDKSILSPDGPRVLPKGSSPRGEACVQGSAATWSATHRKRSDFVGPLLQLCHQKRLRILRHDTARDNAWPQVDGRSADERGAQGHDLEIVVEVLSQAAAERSAGRTWVALAIVTDTPRGAVGCIGKENVGARVDRLRGALEARKRTKICRGVDREENIGIFRNGFVGCREPSRAIRRTPGVVRTARTNASTAPRR
jgi:hypothetical protein